jgi:hypothetical protein
MEQAITPRLTLPPMPSMAVAWSWSYPPANPEQEGANAQARDVAQAIIDHVLDHLYSQGKRSAVEDPEAYEEYGRAMLCCYRGDGGLQCAVGCLLADEAYSPELEDKGVRADSVKDALYRSGIPMNLGWYTGPYAWALGDILTILQECHDESEHVGLLGRTPHERAQWVWQVHDVAARKLHGPGLVVKTPPVPRPAPPADATKEN